MKEIITKVYTFDELSPEAIEKAREWWKKSDDFPFLEEYMSDELNQLLKENKIVTLEEPIIYYSLSYCQGDGAMFAGTVEWQGHTILVKQRGNYYHYNSKEITLPEFEGENEDAIVSKFNDVYVDICKELEKRGYDYIENERSNEVVDENILANEYIFTADGERFGD